MGAALDSQGTTGTAALSPAQRAAKWEEQNQARLDAMEPQKAADLEASRAAGVSDAFSGQWNLNQRAEGTVSWEVPQSPPASGGTGDLTAYQQAMMEGVGGTVGTGGTGGVDGGMSSSTTITAGGDTGFETDEQRTSSPEYLQMQEALAQQQQMMDQQQEQFTAQQGQYAQLKEDFAAREEQLSGMLEGMGTAERAALDKQRAQMMASQKEDLMRRGLTSSSALTAAMRGVDTAANETLQSLNDRLRQQKLDYSSKFSGETLAAQERALNFGAQTTQANFAAGSQVAGGMQSLAAMLSEQRMAGWGNQAELQSTMLNNQNDRYAATLGYKGQLAAIKQKEGQSTRETSLAKYQTDQGNKLGYKTLEQQSQIASMQDKTSYKNAYIGSDMARIDANRMANMKYNR